MKNLLVYIVLGIVATLTIIVIFFLTQLRSTQTVSTIPLFPTRTLISTPSVSPTLTPIPLPISKTLPTDYHIFQTFNNCGPASLSMALSHYGVNVSQQELGQNLRPYQVAGGDNDDKSVTLEELAQESKKYEFTPFHRPAGNPEIIKQFIAQDMPIITRTWTKPSEDIGHYRVVKGYDETRQTLIQDDSLQGKNLEYTYKDFDEIWKKFNYEYLVLVPKEKIQIAESILKEDVDVKTAWKKAVKISETQLQKNPDDIYARFNLSVALFHTEEFKRSKEEFEIVENALPFRTLWYQIEPVQNYVKLKEYDRALSLIEKILNNQNRAFSELYIIRGDIYKDQGNLDAANSEYKQALLYNKNLSITF